MVKHYFFTRALVCLSALFSLALNLTGAVNTITGDTGIAQSGSLIFSGGASGATFDSTSSTITQNVNFLALPSSSSTKGQVIIGAVTALHAYGSQSIFVGNAAGNFTTTGSSNTACGGNALCTLTSGNNNVAMGYGSLASLTTGTCNSACGASAGSSLISGNNNILIGAQAGSAYTGSESNTILVGSAGVSGENNTLRIGAGGGTQTACYIDGIFGNSVDTESGRAVYVDATGKLGTIVSSSVRSCDVVHTMLDDNRIMQLQPVSFCMKHDQKKTKLYGLIAEEVYEILPELVVVDTNGNPYAVRYHELPALLLHALQQKETLITSLQHEIHALMMRLENLEARLNT